MSGRVHSLVVDVSRFCFCQLIPVFIMRSFSESPNSRSDSKLTKPFSEGRVGCILNYATRTYWHLQCHLLHGSNIAEELEEILEEDDLALVMSSDHRPNCLIQLMTHTLKCAQLEDNERSLLVSVEK